MVVYEKLTIGSGDNKYHLRVRCSSCGATAQGNSNINWYNSYSIGDVLDAHYYCYCAFTSGQRENKLCGYEDKQITSIIINGVEYIN